MLEKCSCNHCSGHIEFDASEAGQVVACPHCGLETKLFISPLVSEPTKQPPPLAVTQKKKGLGIIGVLGICFAFILLGVLVFFAFSILTPKTWEKSRVVQQGDLQIKVEGWTELGGVMAESPSEPGGWATYKHLFAMRVAVSNLSKTKKVDFSTWRGESFHLGRDYATLTDDNGNVYKRIHFEGNAIRADWNYDDYKNGTAIYPQTDFTDLLVFEPMVKDLKWLHLELPAGNFGGSGMIRFEIPVTESGWRMPSN